MVSWGDEDCPARAPGKSHEYIRKLVHVTRRHSKNPVPVIKYYCKYCGKEQK